MAAFLVNTFEVGEGGGGVAVGEGRAGDETGAKRGQVDAVGLRRTPCGFLRHRLPQRHP